MNTTPAAVSRVLHRAFRPIVNRNREGVRVTRSHASVIVSADFDSIAYSEMVADELFETLTELGYAVERNPHSKSLLSVTK